jgi:thiamine-phosphate pyrophosphorylase
MVAAEAPALKTSVGPVICLVTDRSGYGSAWEDATVRRVAAAASAGVHLIQVRERDLEARDLFRLTQRCLEAVEGTQTRVIVNDRLDVALAAGAHGVHLPGNGVAVDRLRTGMPPGFLIGRSVHSAAEARAAAGRGGVDYLIFGTIFPTSSKPGVPRTGLVPLADACRSTTLPILAIGGVTEDRFDAVAASGAAGFAAIGLFRAISEPLLPNMVARASAAFDRLRRQA